MTELQVTSVITMLLLANLLIGAGYTVKNMYVPHGGDFVSEVCQATSNTSRLYWKANETSIISDDMAAERGLNISQMTDRTGRLNQSLTAKNVQHFLNLTCIESLGGEEERVVLQYSIHIKEDGDPPSVTGAGAHGDNAHVHDSLNSNVTNTTTGSQSCGKNCIIAVVMVVIAVVAGVVLLAAVVAACIYRYTHRPDRGNHNGGHALVEVNQQPPGGDDDSHDNDDSSGDDQAPPAPVVSVPLPVILEDETAGTMHVAPRPPIRSQPRSNASRDVEPGAAASSACEPTLHIKVQCSNVDLDDPSTMDVTTTGEQCTDKGVTTIPIFSYKNKNLMDVCVSNKTYYTV